MSPSRSEQTTTDPARPLDHVDNDAGAGPVEPALGPAGWARWAWRQLTSMRTALILLLLLALAAVPGSILPQRSADPNGVVQYYRNNPELAPVVDGLQLFDVYSSVWFSAIYLLLFVSLIGCIIPRIRHHAKALRSDPPRTPARLQRLDHHLVAEAPVPAGADPAQRLPAAIEAAERQLRGRRYRVRRYDGRESWSVSAERGYLRESGNLVFHTALVGVLVSVLASGGFSYTGQRVIVEGTTFVNALSGYSSFSAGRFVDTEALPPYSLSLDSFEVTYQAPGTPGAGQAGDFAANLTIRQPGGAERTDTVRVNAPIPVVGDRIHLLGNGYAPTITVRDADGRIVYSDSLPFLPQDSAMTSLGIIKVPDGLPEQVGLLGFLYPTQSVLDTGAYYSAYPALVNPVITFNVYSGDLGIDDGTPRSVYVLDTTALTQLTGGDTGVDSIELRPGESAQLPNGWGTVEFEDASAVDEAGEPVRRFASLQIQRDDAAPWVLLFAGLAVAGLIAGLMIPRRRVWVRASVVDDADGQPVARLEYAGLARGEDPQLPAALERIRAEHLASITDTLPNDPVKEDQP
ncbi:MAG: cytochrome c biogenesis protein ResB [Geminicoccaceae bacterium]